MIDYPLEEPRRVGDIYAHFAPNQASSWVCVEGPSAALEWMIGISDVTEYPVRIDRKVYILCQKTPLTDYFTWVQPGTAKRYRTGRKMLSSQFPPS